MDVGFPLLQVDKFLGCAVIGAAAGFHLHKDYQVVLIGNDVGLQLPYAPIGFKNKVAVLFQIFAGEYFTLFAGDVMLGHCWLIVVRD